MGQGSWGLDEGDDGAEDDIRERDREEFERDLELRKEVKRIKRYGIEPKPYKPRGKTVEVSCKCCGAAFVARVADRKRGWGKFCSKSCKATQQSFRKSKE